MYKWKYIIVAFLVVVLICDFTSNPLIHAKNATSPNHTDSTNLLSKKINWKLVEKAMGKTGVMKTDEVFYISLPRSDLKVTVKGIPIRTGLALGGWMASKQTDSKTMVMGDLVLTENKFSLS